MEIKILGTGCKKCGDLYNLVTKTVEETSVKADVKKIEDIKEIASHGVMMTPGLVINGQTKVSGRVPKKDEIKKWIEEAK
ncbi:MAG: thioredoxin family protein [Firmicutes bacterium]|nr:thioredoxin family protein [Bacillota bacterium]